ncbi:MAG: hypothetical protein GEU68_14085 [Actinobacteria bacterium]|nr:hypothetical protein [Actinomycetota bacterium]
MLAADCEHMIEELYRKVQLPEEWVTRLTHELEEEIVDRQATAADMRVALTRRIAELADERRKLLRAYFANALPLELLKEEQDRISSQEDLARADLSAAEADLGKWQEALTLAIRLAGSCHAAYLEARPKSVLASTRRYCRPCTSRIGNCSGPSSRRCSRLFSGARVRIRGQWWACRVGGPHLCYRTLLSHGDLSPLRFNAAREMDANLEKMMRTRARKAHIPPSFGRQAREYMDGDLGKCMTLPRFRRRPKRRPKGLARIRDASGVWSPHVSGSSPTAQSATRVG